MRISLLNQPQIEALSAALKESLASIVAAIQVGWGKQHDGDGAHTNVTATTVTVSDRATVGQLVLRTVDFTPPFGGVVNDLTVAGLGTASHLRINTNSNPVFIRGIDATGRVQGSVLLLTNGDPTVSTPADIHLIPESATSQAANRFAETLATTGGIGATFILQGARSVWLVYDYQTTGTNGIINPRWRIVDQA